MTEKEFITEWTEKLGKGALKGFPGEFIDDQAKSEDLELPGKNILMGEELFGSFELIDSDGASVMVADSHAKAKYILYSSRGKSKIVKIPLEDEKITLAVKLYEKYLDNLIREMEKAYNESFPKQKNFFAVSNTIFNSLNLKRY